MKKGGHRTGAGRKPKATEIELIELLTPLDAIAFKAIEKGVKAGEFAYIKLFMEYRYGKAKQIMDITTNDKPLEIDPWLRLSYIEKQKEIKEIIAKLESEC